MDKKCVYCNSDQNVNTTMTLPLEGGTKAVVGICDIHAEEASVKTAKQKYLERKAKIDEFMAQAKELGIDIQVVEPAKNGSSVATARVQQIERPAAKQFGPKDVEVDQDDPNSIVVDTKVFDQKNKKQLITPGGSFGAMGAVESIQRHDIDEVRKELPAEAMAGKVKVEVMEGRQGQPIAIPSKRVDGLGTTIITMTKSSDQELQRRTKDMAHGTVQDSHHGYGPHGGYDKTATCPVCRGKCETVAGGRKIKCPKCGGRGEIVVL